MSRGWGGRVALKLETKILRESVKPVEIFRTLGRISQVT